MKKLIGFCRSRLTRTSGVRAIGVFALSLGTAMSVIYANYYNYWEGTIYRTQTVDFNILSNVLSTKLSILLNDYLTLQGGTVDLQQTLDSNYGLFGIVVTNCDIQEVDCPEQKILFASQSTVEELEGGNQKLIPNNNYSRAWTHRFGGELSPNEVLSNSPYILLYNPPPLHQEWGFLSPREEEKVYFEKNEGDVIGRAYLLRANRPIFWDELEKWRRDIVQSFGIGNSRKPLGSTSLVYSSILTSSLITGFLVWLIVEFSYYSTRLAEEKEAKAVKEKIASEQRLDIALDEARKADLERQRAEEAVRRANQKSEQAIQEKIEAERIAHIANQNIDREKQRAEESILIADQKSEQASKEKQEAEEVARLANQKSEQAIQEKIKVEEAARLANQNIALEKQKAEEAVRLANQKSEQAIQEKIKAEEMARLANQKSEKAIQEKTKAEAAARFASQNIVQEKQKAEEAVRLANQKSEQAAQEKQKAEEAVRLTNQKSEQAIQEKIKAEAAARFAAKEREKAKKEDNDLYQDLEKILEEEINLLKNINQDLEHRSQSLEIENAELKSRDTVEIIRLPHLPSNLSSILNLRTFFEWIDSEPRKNNEVESWIKNHKELSSLVETHKDGYSYLNSLGNLLYECVKHVQGNQPRVKWPDPSAIPPARKNCVSDVEHDRPRDWEKVVRKLCEIDCVSKVSYNKVAYGGSYIKVIDAQRGILSLRYGTADLWLPLQVETTARGEDQVSLVIEYIRSRIL